MPWWRTMRLGAPSVGRRGKWKIWRRVRGPDEGDPDALIGTAKKDKRFQLWAFSRLVIFTVAYVWKVICTKEEYRSPISFAAGNPRRPAAISAGKCNPWPVQVVSFFQAYFGPICRFEISQNLGPYSWHLSKIEISPPPYIKLSGKHKSKHTNPYWR